MDEIEPMMDYGWCLTSDLFSGMRPDMIPMCSASADSLDPANLSAMSVPSFMCPCEAFTYIFDSEVIDSLCKWMNERAQVYNFIT
ncbi:hypothetical protein E2C01_045709 [Portunus trituberculatus]|uniref:Uncharacterized protein n=1 Tax=Portunus trituberculatus TaxID=210409 RepID=A0A5B7G361_PORTR|nr:hypothetical protein [Portunus trituberculatus]